MSAKPLTVGFVYVLTNESMPGLVKVGLTSSLPEDRAQDLYTTSVAEAFNVAFRTTTSRPRAVERRAHDLLNEHRINPKREFFRVSVGEAIEAVRRALVDAGGMESWKRPEPHVLATGDRVSLALEAGQAFALIGYKGLVQMLAGRAEVLDLWQAHSDGDLLELYAAESPAHVVGFSDSDPGSAHDPVPYLNRARTVANGFMNGRERLMPGERLVWLPAPGDAEAQVGVVFEARDHCQIVSRTWSPRVGTHGFPLLLNDFLHDDVWPAASRTIREALALPVPRHWAPREGRDSTWAPIGIELPHPDYWLPQLKPRPRKC
jgi:hypothetical protein